MALFDELRWRGFVHDATPQLPEHLASGSRTAYCGFDPTAPSLQVGNLMPLMLLAHLQRGGHRPIVLMGGGTGLIGDPSGKRTERPLLSKEQIRENLQRQRDQMARFLQFGTGKTAALLLDNAKWLVGLKLVDFLRDIGKHFSVNVMLQKESVQARLEGGLSYTEFSYMLLQSYDFLHLFRSEWKCTLQVGGSDQWGNITAGADLIRRVEQGEAHALVAPLVTTSSGAKFGKTEGESVWLDPALTSPYKFYQFWVNTEDQDTERYLKLFTFRQRAGADGIEALMAMNAKDPSKREAQYKLAADVTELVHGQGPMENAVAASAMLFNDWDPRRVKADALETLAKEIPTASAASQDISLVAATITAGLVKSKGEARRAIEQGGLYLNQQRESDVERKLGAEDWLAGGYALLRKGKKDYALLKLQ
jgi:tyrosyl-tRNA synthetase